MKLKNIATRKIRRELARREASAGKLQSQHAELSARLATLASELADLGVDAPARRGRPPGRRGPGRPKGSKNNPGKMGRPKGKRAKNAMSLVEAILKGVRAGSTVSPAEAGAAAKKVGYKSSSPNFGMMVANALSKDSHFKRIERGQYQVGGKAAPKPAAKANPAGKKRGRRPAKGKAAPKKAAKSAPASSLADVVARS